MWEQLRNQYPELFAMGFGDIIVAGVVEGWDHNRILAEVRSSPQYAQQFPGITDTDGSRRFNSEAEYMATIRAYRDVLKEFGMFDETMDSPQAYVSFLDNRINPNELRDRIQTYRTLQRSGRELKDAFYVYAGMRISDDDLYEIVVAGDRNGLLQQYNARTAGSTLDFETFTTRVTELSLERIGEVATELTNAGVMSHQEAQRIMSADPEKARMLIGALYTSGGSSAPLALEELVTAFEYAMIGSAASEQGLVMPDADRLAQFRNAGVDRARAQAAYSNYARQQGLLAGASYRAGGRTVSQDLYEQAVLLGRADALTELQRTMGREAAYGLESGGFSDMLEGDRIAQRGRLAQGSR